MAWAGDGGGQLGVLDGVEVRGEGGGGDGSGDGGGGWSGGGGRREVVVRERVWTQTLVLSGGDCGGSFLHGRRTDSGRGGRGGVGDGVCV